MFAGIVENAGRVLSLQERPEAWLLELALPFADGEGLEAGSELVGERLLPYLEGRQ